MRRNFCKCNPPDDHTADELAQNRCYVCNRPLGDYVPDESEDERLDDPRHGQAADINRMCG